MIKKLIEVKKSNNFDRCIQTGLDSFIENFDHKIRQLLHNFPADYTNPDGSKFWSGSKRTPHPLTYDANNEIHLLFVDSYARIIADALGITVDPKLDINYVKSVSGSVKIPEFKPKRVFIKANENDSDSSGIGDIGKEEEEQITILMNELSLCDKKQVDPKTIKPAEFEKDDDANHHIDFIHAASNLRATNYTISEVLIYIINK